MRLRCHFKSIVIDSTRYAWYACLKCLRYLFFICCIPPAHKNEVCHSAVTLQLRYILMWCAWLFGLRPLLNKYQYHIWKRPKLESSESESCDLSHIQEGMYQYQNLTAR